jgi:hypothetical protein
VPGPFFLAYVAVPEPFDPLMHAVEDEQVVALIIHQDEGDFASLQITVRNPGGLLAPGRRSWCWLSWDDGGEIVPLFTGRIVAVPEQLDGETVRLLFMARPPNYDSLKSDYAATLKILPYFDPVWYLGDLDDADAVFDAYGAQLHIDRVTLELTHSDECEGEDGELLIGEADHTYDNFDLSYTDPPLSQVDIEGTLRWTQSGTGTIDLTKRITQEFKAQGTIYAYVDSYTGLITTLTGDGLMTSWPKGGTTFGGGWTVSNDTSIGDASGSFTRYELTRRYRGIRGDYPEGDEDRSVSAYYFRSHQDYEVTYEVYAFEQHTLFDWEAEKRRTETIKLSMFADIQNVLAEPGDEANIEKLTISADATVTEPDDDGVMPIGDKRRRAYLPTDRGNDSVQYLLLLGRAMLRRRARAVEIRVRVPWEIGVGATLRMNARVSDRRLPGGEASGKIIGYELSAAGTGEFWAEITIGCSVGLGGGVLAAPGEPTWVNDGYVFGGYQIAAGAGVTVLTGDIVYETLDDFTVDDDGVDLLSLDETTSVQSLTVTNGLGPQVLGVSDSDDPAISLKDAPTEVCVQLVPLTDLEFETIFTPTVEVVPLPKTIDLEAA